MFANRVRKFKCFKKKFNGVYWKHATYHYRMRLHIISSLAMLMTFKLFYFVDIHNFLIMCKYIKNFKIIIFLKKKISTIPNKEVTWRAIEKQNLLRLLEKFIMNHQSININKNISNGHKKTCTSLCEYS